MKRSEPGGKENGQLKTAHWVPMFSAPFHNFIPSRSLRTPTKRSNCSSRIIFWMNVHTSLGCLDSLIVNRTEPNQGDNDWPKLKLGLCLFRTALGVMSWLHRRWPCLRYAFAGRPLTRVRDPYTGLLVFFPFLLFLPVHALLAWYAAAAVVCATFVWHLRHRWTKGRRR